MPIPDPIIPRCRLDWIKHPFFDLPNWVGPVRVVYAEQWSIRRCLAPHVWVMTVTGHDSDVVSSHRHGSGSNRTCVAADLMCR